MQGAQYRSIYDKVMAMIKPNRQQHVEGCIAEAIRLAEHWGGDPEKAAFAALLHDVTKSERLEGQLYLCKKYGIILRMTDRAAFGPLHAMTGAAVAREEFHAEADVVRAIRWHTTGRAKMTLLEKILYLADYIEPTRDFNGVEEVRALAYKDLDLAMLTALKNTIMELCHAEKVMSRETIEAYNDFLMKFKQTQA